MVFLSFFVFFFSRKWKRTFSLNSIKIIPTGFVMYSVNENNMYIYVRTYMYILIIFFSMIAGVGCVWLTVIMLMFKLFYVMWRRRKMESMYHVIREVWEVTNEPDERRIYENIAWQAKIFTIIFCCVALFNNIFFTAAAAMPWIKSYTKYINKTDIVRDLPFDIW